MTLRKRENLMKQGYQGELKLKENERLSERPFGHHTRKGRFILDIDKVPFFNIPDLTGFNLKPYVAHGTAKIDSEMAEKRVISLTPQMIEEIEEKIKNTPRGAMAINEVEAGDLD